MRQWRVTLIAFFVAFLIALSTYLMFFGDLFSRNEYSDPGGNGRSLSPLFLSKEIQLKFCRLFQDKNVYVTESPITNEQFYVAVAEKGAFPPEMPHELNWNERKEGLEPFEGVMGWEAVTWLHGIYPEGQGSNAVIFVNHKDSSDFCRWLGTKCNDYDFRLPNDVERMEMETNKVVPNQRLSERDNAFPRPVSGPKAIRIKERFWMAPWTHELLGFQPGVLEGDEERKVRYLRSFGPSGRYISKVAGSIGTARILPTTFRVIAVKKSA